MRALAFIFAIALSVAVPHLAFAQPAEAPSRHLLLEVWLNGQSRALAVEVVDRNGVLWVERGDLAAIGIKDVADSECEGGLVPLNRIGGVRATIEESKQQLMVAVAADRLATTVLDLRRGRDTPVVTGTPVGAFVLDYDAVVTETDATTSLRKTSFDAAGTLTAFTPYGTFVTNGLAHSDPDEDKFLRLDTSWTLDDPPELRRLTVGDAISGGTAWSRSVRFGGVQLARDFSLQPELVTMPLPDFFGDAAVPGSIDVFVGASKVLSEGIPAGPFDVRDLPIVTGGGQATVVVRDMLGRETTKTINFFGDSRMLAEGLTSYSIDAGFLRESYGLKSFDYGDAVVSGTLRHGLYDELTVEAHAEATEDVAVVGVGGVVSLFDFGSFALAGAGSTSEFGTGGFGSATLQADFGPINLFAAVEFATADFRDVASFDGASLPRETLQLGGSAEFGDYGTLALSFLRVERHDDERTTLATATYSVSMGHGITFGVTSVYNAERDSLLAETFITVPLGDNGPYATAAVRTQEGDTEVRAILEQPVANDGGFGYRLQAAQNDTTRIDAEARWLGHNVALTGRVASADDDVTAQLGAAGAIVAADDSVFFTRKLDGTFALVDAGEPGVRIYRENREIAESDENGKALLTGLTPFVRNRVSIAPGDYDMSRVLATTDLEVVPGRGGTAISLAPSNLKPAMVTVTMPDGSFPAVGTTVRFGGSAEPWIVGHNGGLFIQDLKLPLEVTLETKIGPCSFVMTEPPLPTPGEIPRAGPVSCALDEATAPPR
jgi:outer membrane usher protein